MSHQSKAAAVDGEGRPLKMAEGKLDLTLLDPLIWEGMCRPYEYGLTKYHRNSWQKFTLQEARDLMPSALRHINAYRKGKYYDQESGLPHLTMAMFNLATIYWHETMQGGMDERIEPEVARDIMSGNSGAGLSIGDVVRFFDNQSAAPVTTFPITGEDSTVFCSQRYSRPGEQSSGANTEQQVSKGSSSSGGS